MEHVIIGVDPHKLSATIEVVDRQEKLLGLGRFTTDQAGYAAMRKYAKTWPDRVWAIEGANGTGRPLAQRLLEAGERVLDVPAKLAARVRLFDTGHNRKTDALDAHSIAIVAVRTRTLRVLRVDGELEELRVLADRREALTRRRVQTVDRLQALLAELLPGQAKKDITPLQAKAMLASVRPRDVAGRTRRRIAAEELAELVAVEAKIKKATAELKSMVLARDSRLMNLPGVGPVVAARVLADVGDVARFADRNRFLIRGDGPSGLPDMPMIRRIALGCAQSSTQRHPAGLQREQCSGALSPCQTMEGNSQSGTWPSTNHGQPPSASIRATAKAAIWSAA
jgi:transposase